jgi:putative ABC transport system permease protein
VRLIGQVTNRTGDISIDGSVLAFAAAISLATGVVFGAAPAFAARKDFAALLRSTRGGTLGRARQRIHRGLIVLQLSVSLVLLVSAGLLLASFERLQNVDVGYDGENVLSAEVFGNFSKYPDVPSLQRLYEIIVDRLRGQPAVQAVAVTNSVPLSTTQPGTSAFMVQGHAMEAATVYPTADQRVVTPDYFATLGVRLLDGRDFDDFDTSSNEPVAIVNDTMRQQYWPRPSAIGGRISFDEGKSWRTVVGVAPDLKQFGLDHGAVMQVYVPLAQHSRPVSGRIMIRTETDPLSASAMLRQNVLAIDAALPVENVQTLAQLREQQLSTPRFASILLIAFAVVALAITMVGLAGVIALYVNQRVREFGVRMALGGHASHVVRLVMREALALLALGVVGGLLGAIVVTRILSTYLFDTPAMDPLVIAGAVLLLALAASAACLAPALRATRVPILIVLQSE